VIERMVLKVYAASQQESNRRWSSIFCKTKAGVNFLE